MWDQTGDPVYMIDLLSDFVGRGMVDPPDPRLLHGALVDCLDEARQTIPSVPRLHLGVSVGMTTETLFYEEKARQRDDGPDTQVAFEPAERPLDCARRLLVALGVLGALSPDVATTFLRRRLGNPFCEATACRRDSN